MTISRSGTLALAIALLAGAATAGAVDGNLYPVGPSGPPAVGAGAAASTADGVHTVVLPAADPASAGEKWALGWACHPGTELAVVRFGILRTAEASSLEVRVGGDSGTAWAAADAALPQSPAPGVLLGAALPPGSCTARLSLHQVEARRQHRRTYFVDRPVAWMRDVSPPVVAMGVPVAEWVNAQQSTAFLSWSVADNMGEDGLGTQSVHIAGRTVWNGPPRAGGVYANPPLTGIPDGRHAVVVEARGDGTASGFATGAVAIDRTGPVVIPIAPQYPGGPFRVRLGWAVTDATSGLADSRAEVLTASGWEAVAEATGPGIQVHEVALPGTLPEGVHQWRVVSRDVAGNITITPGPEGVLIDATAPELTVHLDEGGWVRSARLDVTAADAMAPRLGLGPRLIEHERGAGWHPLGAAVHPPGRVAHDLSPHLDDGIHRLRVTQINGPPFGALRTERTVTLRVDGTAPRVRDLSVVPLAEGPLRATWTAEDATSGVVRAVLQWHDGTTWRTLGTTAAQDGAGAVVVDATALGGRRPPVRLVVADAAGNVGVADGAVSERSPEPQPAPRALGSEAPDPLAHLRGARLSLSVPRGRVVAGRGLRTVIATVASGGRVGVAGRLRDGAGRWPASSSRRGASAVPCSPAAAPAARARCGWGCGWRRARRS